MKTTHAPLPLTPFRGIAHALAAVFALVALLAASACSRAPAPPPSPSADAASPAPNAPATYHAVATVGMVADIVRAVAGEHARVTGLIGTGVDPHLYKPTRNDVAALMAADIVFYSGHLLEGKMTETLEHIGRSKPAIAVAERVAEQYLLQAPGPGHHPDPHLWMDVGAWKQAVRTATQALVDFDPAHADSYLANSTRYLGELEALDAYARTCIASIPAGSRVLITAHDAFSYFGRAYGIEVRGIQGISTESEAGLEDIRRLVAMLVERNVRAVFVESSVPDKNVRALLEGAHAQGHAVQIGGELYSDAMGLAGTYEGTYIGMIDHNVTLITRALGGQAPELGLFGRLTPPSASHPTAGATTP